MGFLNQVESSSSCKVSDRRRKKKIFKNRSSGLEKKFKELRTLCGVNALFYLKSEFNRNGLVRALPQNPNEFQKIVKDYMNYDPKRGKGKRVLHQPVDFNDHKISDLSIEELEKIERNLEAMFDEISDRMDELTEKIIKEESGEPSEMGCNNENAMIVMNEYLGNEFEYDSNNRDSWLSLPGPTTNDGIV